MNHKEIITLENISKKYDKWVLRDINGSFFTGESVAFMGHNGCGKSTLLKIITGLVKPTGGFVKKREPLSFSYVPEKFIPVVLSARTYLRRMGELDGIGKWELEEMIEQYAKDFFLEDMLDIPLKSLSKGTLQKIGVIQALLIKRKILLLDEPLSGQDEASQGVFVNKINDLRAQNVTIFTSCHEQWLADAISDKVLTIKNGKLAPVMKGIDSIYVLYIEWGNEETAPKIKYKDSRDDIFDIKPYGKGFVIRVSEKNSQKLILQLLQAGWQLKGMYDENKQNVKISASNLF